MQRTTTPRPLDSPQLQRWTNQTTLPPRRPVMQLSRPLLPALPCPSPHHRLLLPRPLLLLRPLLV